MESFWVIILTLTSIGVGLGIGFYILLRWIYQHTAGSIIASDMENGEQYLAVEAKYPVKEIAKKKYVIFEVRISR